MSDDYDYDYDRNPNDDCWDYEDWDCEDDDYYYMGKTSEQTTAECTLMMAHVNTMKDDPLKDEIKGCLTTILQQQNRQKCCGLALHAYGCINAQKCSDCGVRTDLSGPDAREHRVDCRYRVSPKP